MVREPQTGYTQTNAHTKTHPTQTAETEVKKNKTKNPKSSQRKTTHYLKGSNYLNDYEFRNRNHGYQIKVL